MSSAVKRIDKISFDQPLTDLGDPWIFCAHHVDNYPAGDPNTMGPVTGGRGNGAHFDPKAPWRWYHGRTIPGFPAHPHRGFETISITMHGDEVFEDEDKQRFFLNIDHCDSMGNAGRFGQGDIHWMTAGRGISHGEMFPLLRTDGPNNSSAFQLWLNLPRKSKFADPFFVMHWHENIRRVTDVERGNRVTVYAGEFNGVVGQTPPPHSWASEADSDVAIWLVSVRARGGSITLPPAKTGASAHRRLLFHIGPATGVRVAEHDVSPSTSITLDSTQSVEIVNDSEQAAAFLMLQARPIGEPVVSHGPFVMNTREEIRQAFEDYQETQFGGWPWPSSAHVFPRDKGRFSIIDGVETRPPSVKK